MLKILTAIERDGLDVRVLSMVFDVPNKEFDIQEGLRKAVTDYCKTEEGRKTYDYNCGNFNLADVDSSLPKMFCEKYGFSIVDTVITDDYIDWDESFCENIGEDV